ncbi:MAG TPA: hypothetical protein VM529_09720, partial [Gemmata sp.]|nr:hypothetical protein [Gemmata sp.]
MRIPNPFKPWFVYRPGQLCRRFARAVRPPADPVQVVDLPWGCPLEIDTRETIGRSVWTAGVYDLAVVEVLTRLADRGRLAVDAGANVGAMTGALAARAGEVWAFEPHPDVFRSLEANVARFAGLPGFAPTRAFDLARARGQRAGHRADVRAGVDRQPPAVGQARQHLDHREVVHPGRPHAPTDRLASVDLQRAAPREVYHLHGVGRRPDRAGDPVQVVD